MFSQLNMTVFIIWKVFRQETRCPTPKIAYLGTYTCNFAWEGLIASWIKNVRKFHVDSYSRLGDMVLLVRGRSVLPRYEISQKSTCRIKLLKSITIDSVGLIYFVIAHFNCLFMSNAEKDTYQTYTGNIWEENINAIYTIIGCGRCNSYKIPYKSEKSNIAWARPFFHLIV